MGQLTALILSAIAGQAIVQKPRTPPPSIDPLANRRVTFMVPLGPTHASIPRTLTEEAVALPLTSKRQTLKGGYTAFVNAEDVIVISDDLPELRDLRASAAVATALKRFPKGPVQRLGDYGPDVNKLVVERIDETSPMNLRRGASLPPDTKFAPMPVHALEISSGNRTVKVEMWAYETLGATPADRKASYRELDARAVPQLAKTEKEARRNAELMVAAYERSPKDGYQMLLTRRGKQEQNAAATSEKVIRVYREYAEELRKAAEKAMEGIEEDVRRQFPDTFGGAAQGKSFAELPKAFQDALRGALSLGANAAFSSTAEMNSFLANATISKSTAGLILGVSTAPDFTLLGVRVWPR